MPIIGYQLRASLPVLVTLSITWLLAPQLASYPGEPPPIITPIPESSAPPSEALLDPAPYFNALILVALMAAGGALLVLFLKHAKALKVLGATLTAVTAFAATSYHLLLLTPAPIASAVSLAALAAAWVAVSLVKLHGIPSVAASAYVGASAGAIVGTLLPFWTAVVLMLAVSGYDLLAVYVGHLRLLGNLESSIPGFMVEYGGMSIGMGDLFFYSVAQSFTLSRLGLVPGFMTSLGLLLGFLLTVRLASTRKIVAGLPIPLTLSMALAFAGSVLAQ